MTTTKHFLTTTITAITLAIVTPIVTADTSDAEIAVYSGVPCGIAASITAAREGAKVLLIEPTKHVGGLSTSGINTAESEHMLKWTIGGFADEFYQRMGRHYEETKDQQTYPHKDKELNTIYFFESSVAEKVYLDMLKEAGVEVRYGASVDQVTKDGAKITGITLTDGTKIASKVFIDASYEGDLMARAGVKYGVGRESKAEFGEEAAGIRFDKTPRKARTVDAQGRLLPGISAWAKNLAEGGAHRAPMNYNFRLTVAKDPQFQVPIPAPRRYDAIRYSLLADWLRDQASQKKPVKLSDIIDLYERRNGKFELNNKQSAIFSLGHFGGQFDWPDASYEQRARIYEDHMDYTLGLLHFLATDAAVPANVQKEMKSLGLHKGEFADNGHLPYQLYVREARRMRGEHVMTQRDVQTDRRKPDSIGMSSHFIDCHHVQRVALNENEFVNEGRIWRMGWANQIPYRAITPKPAECTNLLVPGAASYTHVAFCTLRLESTWMITGHAAGVAAAMAAKDGTDVQRVNVTALQDKLRAQKQVIDFLPGQPEKCEHLNGPPEF
ncbi:MAG: FAD-dependent oxidoreductase [Armatimonadetes bacterium]|nr:FAD-dependent oxidoreductase [Akkermansiaceae bacterium]